MSASLVGETIGVLGLARSGLAAARLALARGARVYASDGADNPQTRRAADAVIAMGGLAEVGRHDLGKLARCDKIVLSPGIPPTAPVLRAPEIAHVPVIPEIEFAFGLLECPVIAITGTNGKTTVTSLIGHLLREHGEDAAVGGNIGTALSELVMREPQPRVAVVETSSFQLGGIREFNPRIGVLTNLAPDHLDWYSSVDSYYADKAHLFRNATGESRWVLNGEDEKARALPGNAPGTRWYFRIRSALPEGELGGYLADDGWLVLRLDDGREERILPADRLRILGPHNVANALAASIAARLAGGPAAVLPRGAAGGRLARVHRARAAELRGAAAPAGARGRGRRRALDQRQQGHQHRLYPGGAEEHDPADRAPPRRAPRGRALHRAAAGDGPRARGAGLRRGGGAGGARPGREGAGRAHPRRLRRRGAAGARGGAPRRRDPPLPGVQQLR